ncbi:MAG TPA: cytidine deaminase [Polyangiaceae bacterium]|jgi:cytidine deaminase|nr:cytidine deaminase [Polyangiaceae bacterium]
MTDAAAIDWEELGRAAIAVQARAHAPYSKYPVGAALLVASGRVFAGCNVENASYGLSICAERSALVQMVAAGESGPIALAVVTPGPMIGTPCGTCRQTLAEFAEDLPIQLRVADSAAPPRMTSLEALLPDAFRAVALKR